MIHYTLCSSSLNLYKRSKGRCKQSRHLSLKHNNLYYINIMG